MVSPDDPDAALRAAAFARLAALRARHGDVVPWTVVAEPFAAAGATIRLANRAKGIFSPAAMRTLLSVKTVRPRAGRTARYADQSADARVFSAEDAPFHYDWEDGPETSHGNRMLREAMERGIPVIWFWAVAPALYRPVAPVYVAGWDVRGRRAELAPALQLDSRPLDRPPALEERRYALRLAKRRLHQDLFRIRVVEAYGARCAFSGLPVASLVDAAHIVPDADETLGQPLVSNGLCLSRLHHAAFDAHLIGVDPARRIRVSARLMAEQDGPTLEAMKLLDGRALAPPGRPDARPDQERLERRWSDFLAEQ